MPWLRARPPRSPGGDPAAEPRQSPAVNTCPCYQGCDDCWAMCSTPLLTGIYQQLSVNTRTLRHQA
jgi:hypothetical protein